MYELKFHKIGPIVHKHQLIFAACCPLPAAAGGEPAFVGGMVEDSLLLRGQVHWFTTMVGWVPWKRL